MGKRVAVEDWLRARCSAYDFGIGGVYRLRGEYKWPLVAKDEADLQQGLETGCHILPLPKGTRRTRQRDGGRHRELPC
ncbi:hypothetical protein MKCMC460_08570 [Mycobacterium sp. 20KCMC460]|uniref:Uncharacterized protein n=1 Tax=Mycobacterium kiyosense TaxID=2871094 RepID=A0A9P3UZY4_9MYCO|nr:hypothetical protein IWGMT90018_06100 [Mycobacterium kiyosense]BDE11997.1 hypothetical protein MKCMC460_08570 [Mycobacterium sp. 20KCMC460]GLB85174.1 hypothetical protein SRL2020028_44300 [Mycobacterium kiyosense]GLB99106.1 hypothetical protein SRL2020226_58820 [Mycobacterium kiyosense]GLC22679.1 hypothetical protein SRL2020472_52500 [Mycobacterium kiyosense]